MQIFKTVQKTESIEVTVPSFYRAKNEKSFLGILDDKTIVSIYDTNDLKIIKNCVPVYAEEIKEAIETWHSCTETEFLDKYDAVIESISLHPKLAV